VKNKSSAGKSVILFLLLTVLPSIASQKNRHEYDSPSGPTSMQLDESVNAIFSMDCFDKKAKKSKACDARKTLQSVTFKPMSFKTKYAGQSPADLLCSSLGAEVIILQDKKRNQTGACKFNDGSSVISGALVVWAKKNTKHSKK